nr:hypothetical protein [Sphaerisporangium cinnabarinum]
MTEQKLAEIYIADGAGAKRTSDPEKVRSVFGIGVCTIETPDAFVTLFEEVPKGAKEQNRWRVHTDSAGVLHAAYWTDDQNRASDTPRPALTLAPGTWLAIEGRHVVDLDEGDDQGKEDGGGPTVW